MVSTVFPSTNFMFMTKGIKDLVVTNERRGLSDRLTGIEVVHADVSGFISSISVQTAIAGTALRLSITGATDSFGNKVNGTIYVSITNSPIIDYSLNDISINNGVGSNSQVILDASSNAVTFRMIFNAVTNYISLAQVLPAEEVGDIRILSAVSVVTAGKFFNSDVTVQIYDIYNNLKFNATNYIYFFNTAGDGVFAYNNTNQFQYTNNYIALFNRTNFLYPVTGTNDIDSVPPAIIQSAIPVFILAVAIAIASSPEAQYLLMVIPGTS